jgi:hypothetical protein
LMHDVMVATVKPHGLGSEPNDGRGGFRTCDLSRVKINDPQRRAEILALTSWGR